MKRKRYQNILLVLFATGLMLNFSCKKMIEVDLPVDKTTAETTYGSINTAVITINGVYANLANSSPMGLGLGKVADEISPIAGRNAADFLYQNNYINNGNWSFSTWNNFYSSYIYTLNSVIEGVTKSNGIGENSKKILIAEAKFTRAFLYFYLVNLYGDVPLVLTTDYKVNSNIARNSVDDVYTQIIADLTEAKGALSTNYLNSDLVSVSSLRVRPNKYAATALLARVFLFKKQWANAELQASELINNTVDFKLEPIADVFIKESRETILAFQPNLIMTSDAANNTVDGQTYIPYLGNTPQTVISQDLQELFAPEDLRFQQWLGEFIDNSTMPNLIYFYPFKYKIGQNFSGSFQEQKEVQVVFRLAEQYLIRAEARAQLGKVTGNLSAQEDLDAIRTRAGLNGSTANTVEQMLTAIYKERQLELFSEWGHRWLDLKRTGSVDGVMSSVTPRKGGTWSSYKALFPIPYAEFVNNQALKGHQNPGFSELPVN